MLIHVPPQEEDCLTAKWAYQHSVCALFRVMQWPINLLVNYKRNALNICVSVVHIVSAK